MARRIQKKFGIDPLPDIDSKKYQSSNVDLYDEYDEWRQKHNADAIGYKIAGISYRNLDSSHVGPFKGTLRIEPDNPYDPKAVAIFRGRKKVGYIPKEYSLDVYDELLNTGGEDHCIGYIYTFFDNKYQEKFAGRVIGPLQENYE